MKHFFEHNPFRAPYLDSVPNQTGILQPKSDTKNKLIILILKRTLKTKKRVQDYIIPPKGLVKFNSSVIETLCVYCILIFITIITSFQ